MRIWTKGRKTTEREKKRVTGQERKGTEGCVCPSSGAAQLAGSMGDVSWCLIDVVRGGLLKGVGLEDT